MKEKLMKEIQQAMNGKLSDRQKEQLVTAMRSCLQKYQISEPDGWNVFPLGDRICFFSHCLFLPVYHLLFSVPLHDCKQPLHGRCRLFLIL